jgi:integrase
MVGTFLPIQLDGGPMPDQTVRLTATVVNDAELERKAYYLWDTTTKGFAVRVMPSGAKSWVVQYRVGKGRNAKKRRVTIAKVSALKLAAARERAHQYIGKAAFAEDLAQELADAQKGQFTVNDAIDLWIKEASSINRRTGAPRRPENVKLDVDRLDIHVRPLLGDKPLSAVTKADIELLRDAVTSGKTAVIMKTRKHGVRKARGGAGTATRAVRVLSSVFAYAEDHELVDKNPCRGVRLQPSRKCERYLTKEEAKRLGEVLNAWDEANKSPTGVAVVRMLILTGARRREITDLKWSEVDFDQGFLRLEQSKTGKSIRPLSQAALDFLRARPRLSSIWVFPSATLQSPYQGIEKVWREVRRGAGLDDVRLHDLRLPVIGALLGHKDVSTTQRYAHLANDSARKAANELGTLVNSALGPAGE